MQRAGPGLRVGGVSEDPGTVVSAHHVVGGAERGAASRGVAGPGGSRVPGLGGAWARAAALAGGRARGRGFGSRFPFGSTAAASAPPALPSVPGTRAHPADQPEPAGRRVAGACVGRWACAGAAEARWPGGLGGWASGERARAWRAAAAAGRRR